MWWELKKGRRENIERVRYGGEGAVVVGRSERRRRRKKWYWNGESEGEGVMVTVEVVVVVVVAKECSGKGCIAGVKVMGP